jgi:peptidoglycan/LPS O-acetylase OafA/YrhL
MHRENNFDGLRLLGAFLVLGSHQFALSGRQEPLAVAPYTFGTLGVLIFFSISGFLVASSWRSDPHILRFAARRFLRIWPALAVVVIGLAVLAAIFRSTERHAALAFLKNLVLIHNDDGKFFATNSYTQLDGSIWTIPIEVSCYAGFAAIALISRKWLAIALACTSVLALWWLARFSDAGMREAALQMGHPTYAWWFGAFFLFGALLCWWPRLQALTLLWAAAGLAIILLGKVSLGLLVLLPPVVVAIGLRSWLIVRRCGRFGDLSYGLYLFAWPVQQTVVLFLGRERPLLLLLAVSAAITTLFAYASWHLVEKQALKLKPRRTASRARVTDDPTLTAASDAVARQTAP